ncbi:WD40 repeat-containing protein [Cavenderia fasciculata]|uniref:WD40 repeat-containing protein n=1 Tax=Cavenderia fasciculata TaxID=261658 RepID=F4Q6C5_CACFS|nr:WD40 repeat-containing protein [Cavenderia fasciculata]EGG16435.1 WD40 repeat-containing protein [Cavenderia fasciculata]|eukprot:XP_004354835.1 WD40 repeat-containing protein [Cavenderia fasciculata]
MSASSSSTYYSFDKYSKYFACVDQKTNQLLVWNTTNSSEPLRTYSDDRESSKLTCLSIFTSTKASSIQKGVIAIGTNYGDVLIYNILSGKMEKRLTGAHAGCKVVGVVFGTTEKDIFSCDIDGRVAQWQHDGKPNTVQAEEGRDVASIAVSDKGTVLVTGSTHVRFWDVSQMASLRKHKLAKSQDSLTFLASLVVSASSQDQYLSVFDTDSGSAVNKKLLQTIKLSSNIQHLSSYSKEQHQYIAAVTDNKMVEIHKITPSKVLDSTKVTIENAQAVSLVSCSFVNQSELIIVHANKDNLKKSIKFEQFAFTNKDTSFIRYLPVNKQQQDEQSKESKKSTTTTPQDNNNNNKKSNNTTTSNKIMTTMGDVPIESPAQSVDRATAVIDNKQKSSTTVVDLVVQGLTSSDMSLLGKALASRQEVIINTVKALPSPYAYNLLKKISTDIATELKNSHILLMWISNIIKYHSAYLLTVPSLRQQLAVLNSVVEDKYKLHESMTKLVGKFELIESQKNASIADTIDYNPTLVYEDNSDEEESEDDDEDEDMQDDSDDSEAEFDPDQDSLDDDDDDIDDLLMEDD